MAEGRLYIGNRRYSSWSMRGWLALTPRRHGWLHGSLTDARKDAVWLAKNFGGLAVLEVTTTTTT